MAEIKDLNTTDASNTGTAANAGWPEGMKPSEVNNAARALSGMIARYYADHNGSISSGGSSSAYTLAASRTISAIAAGDSFIFKANHASTGATTIAIDGLDTKSIKKMNDQAIAANDIESGSICHIVYDGTNFQLISSVATGLTQLASQLDVNGQALGDGTRELLTFTENGSAVNHWNIENQASGGGPILRPAGDDSNIDAVIESKGTGLIQLKDLVRFNVGADVASATSLPLIKDGSMIDVTGTTTVTSFASTGIGSMIVVQFDGALVLTHHSTDLILPGAANITTAAGDIGIFYEYASGDYRCISYQVQASPPGAGGSVAFVSAQSASSSSSIDFTGFELGYDYIGSIHDVLPAADNMRLEAFFGTGGTPTYQTSAYITYRLGHVDTTVSALINDSTTAMKFINSGQGSGATEFGAVQFQIFNPMNSGVNTEMFAQSAFHGDGTDINHEISYFNRGADEAVTAIRFKYPTGNIAQGEFAIWKRKRS